LKRRSSLVKQYRLTFHWGNPGLKWWLVGQNKGSNTLLKTAPRPAKDLELLKPMQSKPSCSSIPLQ
jgi:hypothetical protein